MTNDRWPIWMRALRPDELTRRRMKRAILDEALPLLTARRDSWFDAVADWATILSPVAAAIAVDPAALSAPAIWLLAGMVLCWVSGFDVIYALQDVEVDRRDGLKSIPVRFGVSGAMKLSRLLHVFASILLFAVYRTEPAFGPIFLGAAILVAVLLIIEHATVHRWGTTRMAITFMTINGIVSIVVGTAGAIELLRAGG